MRLDAITRLQREARRVGEILAVMARYGLGDWLTSLKAPPVIGGISVFGASGYALAVWWGWRLYRAIRRSGNLDSSDHKP